MAILTKRRKAMQGKIDRSKNYAVTEALKLAKEFANAKFDESVDVAVALGIDARKSDQLVRGSVVLPAGTGKSVRVAVFAQGDKAEAAKAAGADIVGLDDLAAEVKAGNLNFDVVIATPDTMRVVGQLGQILGPRGLMPNPKVGTVTADVAVAVKNAKTDKAPIELLLKEFDRYRTVKIDYHGGLRYPVLERIEGSTDYLTPIFSARK